MKCTACGFENIDEVKFCGKCGLRLMQAPTSVLKTRVSPPPRPHLRKEIGTVVTTRRETRPDGYKDSADADSSIPASQYKIIELIGSGGMGTVYLARDEKLGRYVALKRLGKEFLDNPWMKERLFREAKSIAGLSHAHIVQVYALGEDEKGPFIVMEYVAGPEKAASQDLACPPLNLAERIQKEGILSNQDTVNLMRKLCDAVAYAHKRGVIHRDLKPSNVLLNELYEPKIVDFGLARRAHAKDIRLTDAGAQILSLGYGAPEQETDASTADERADIYALGGILYFCLTGENPRFFRENKVPSHLLPPLLKALAKDRQERWKTVKEFDQALAASEPLLTTSKPPTTGTGMWRCKWCHTTNPLVNRYCSECGWDGQGKCPECGTETRVGIRFCGKCGSDIKAFEEATQLLSRLRAYFDQKNYTQVLKQADDIKGFQPRRDAGRTVLYAVEELKKKAENTLERIDTLRDAIPKAMEHQKYEQVLELVREYETLDNTDVFAELKVELPSKITESRVSHNMQKIRRLLAHRDWAGAEFFCRNIIDHLKHDHADAKRILRRLAWRRCTIRIGALLAILAGGFTLYVLGICPAFVLAKKIGTRSAVRIVQSSYAPVLWLYENTALKPPLEKYAELWNTNFDITTADSP